MDEPQNVEQTEATELLASIVKENVEANNNNRFQGWGPDWSRSEG
jgi:hypothetical protein